MPGRTVNSSELGRNHLLGQLGELHKAATGELGNCLDGLCPGSPRDPDCPACKVLLEVESLLGLDNLHCAVLGALDTCGGFTLGEVVKRVVTDHGGSSRERSAVIRSVLLDLEKRGLVRRLDDGKPVCWVRVAPERREGI